MRLPYEDLRVLSAYLDGVQDGVAGDGPLAGCWRPEKRERKAYKHGKRDGKKVFRRLKQAKQKQLAKRRRA